MNRLDEPLEDKTLDGVRARSNSDLLRVETGILSHSAASDIAWLLDRLQAVLDLHAPRPMPEGLQTACKKCNEIHPCQTRRLIEGTD